MRSSDNIDFIIRDDDDFVFVNCQIGLIAARALLRKLSIAAPSST